MLTSVLFQITTDNLLSQFETYR